MEGVKLDALIWVDLLQVQISEILLKIPYTRNRVLRHSPPEAFLCLFIVLHDVSAVIEVQGGLWEVGHVYISGGNESLNLQSIKVKT